MSCPAVKLRYSGQIVRITTKLRCNSTCLCESGHIRWFTAEHTVICRFQRRAGVSKGSPILKS